MRPKVIHVRRPHKLEGALKILLTFKLQVVFVTYFRAMTEVITLLKCISAL